MVPVITMTGRRRNGIAAMTLFHSEALGVHRVEDDPHPSVPGRADELDEIFGGGDAPAKRGLAYAQTLRRPREIPQVGYSEDMGKLLKINLHNYKVSKKAS